MQLSKTVYFRDYPAYGGIRSGLTIPFAEADSGLYGHIASLSSYNIRQLIGFDLFVQLERAATKADSHVATFTRELIRENSSKSRVEKTDRGAFLQATFRGGKGSPLHEWYPYLEGYSPDFVTSILSEFAPEAEIILDPFCGSGTTALVAALANRMGLYSEVNPVCRFIIAAKTRALRLDEPERHRIADQLTEYGEKISAHLKAVEPDSALKRAFDVSFGNRPFFDTKTYNTVLRLRSLIDKIEKVDKALATFFTVAVLRSLVPGSLLVRRGDLRFRTVDEISKSPPNLLGEIKESIHIVASDLLDASIAPGGVRLVCLDARTISQHLQHPVDAIITSPPYLNGTNYFRNTKIELWFLRCLSSKAQLRTFRDAAITAGINDVTLSKTMSGVQFDAPKSLEKVLSDLKKSAYDQRIPLMVQSYFQEMNVVIGQLRAVSRVGTTVAIDLGDSCYGDVWVPTDQIFTQLMEQSGFRQTDHTVLRERQSRDGRKLSQTLQVFKVEDRAKSYVVPSVHTEKADAQLRWMRFRDELPHQQGDMAKRNWGHSWHSLCSYQGKLKPSIGRALTAALLPESNGRLLDPFSGVGTIPFEARLQGHVAIGFDISPAAVVISRAKLERVSKSDVTKTAEQLESWIKSQRNKSTDIRALESIRFNGPLPSYFHERTFREIVAARSFFLMHPAKSGGAALVQSALLHILHGNRPYALSRRSHPITPFAPTGPAEYKPLIHHLWQKVERALLEFEATKGPVGRSYFQDATAPWPDEVDRLDAIVTSPPFFDSTRFHMANWMRLWFAGWESVDFSRQPAAFVDERQKQTFEVYDSIFAQGAERLKPSGYFAIHLGKSAKCDMAAALSSIGKRHMKLLDSFSESVSHCESHGIRDKGTVTHHQYLLFQRI